MLKYLIPALIIVIGFSLLKKVAGLAKWVIIVGCIIFILSYMNIITI